MKKSLIASILAAPLLALAGGGTYAVPVGTNMPVIAGFASGQDIHPFVSQTTNGATRTGMQPWTNAHAYVVGEIASIRGWPYVVQTAGTSGGTAPAVSAETVTDNTVTWLQCCANKKTMVLVQLVSGACTVYFAGGPVAMTVAGSVIGVSDPSCYQGTVTANAVTTNTTVNAVWF